MSYQQLVVGFLGFLFFLCIVGMFGGLAIFLLAEVRKDERFWREFEANEDSDK